MQIFQTAVSTDDCLTAALVPEAVSMYVESQTCRVTHLLIFFFNQHSLFTIIYFLHTKGISIFLF